MHDHDEPAKAPLLSLAPPDVRVLDALLRAQAGESFSYGDVGATRTALPAGYRHGVQEARLGRGEDAFRRAVEGLRHWRAHVGGGVAVYPPDLVVAAGTDVVLLARLGPALAVVCSRVVYVVDEADRFGFAYGTLPHHLIQGEEAFMIERDVAGEVRFHVRAFFRPRPSPLRLVGRVVYALDQHLVRRYIDGMQAHTRAASG